MYHNFIGVDIGKSSFVVAQYGQNVVHTFDNNPSGFEEFCQKYEPILLQSLVILETTGGYEMALLNYLLVRGTLVHRANSRKVKYFIRSLGKLAKTDAIDAAGLASYGYERHNTLEVFVMKLSNQEQLQQFVQRRRDLKQILVQEKNRKQAPNQHVKILQSCVSVINKIEDELKSLDSEIKALNKC